MPIRSVTFPMFRSRVSPIGLADILRKVPENDWKGVLLDVDGAGTMPRGMTFQQWEKELLGGGRLELDWIEVKEFSESLQMEIDMRIVAVDRDVHVEFDTFLDPDFHVAIEARDSTEWEVWESSVEGFAGSLEDAYPP